MLKKVVNPALIEIEPRNCLIDELHLLLRITDVRFFIEMHALDHKAKVHSGTTTDDHVHRGTGNWEN